MNKFNENFDRTTEEKPSVDFDPSVTKAFTENELEREKEFTRQEKWKTTTAITNYWARVIFLPLIFLAVGFWMWCVFTFIQDCSLIEGGKYVADNKVLISMVGGTSASALTLLILIIKYLFPAAEKQ